MRMVDAEAIQYEPMLSAKGNGMYEDVMVAYKSQIDDLPTIEERKTGKWLFPYGDKKYKRCSVCERDYYSIPHNSNFCPNCGARMER